MLVLDVRLRAKRYGVTSPKPACQTDGRRRERHQEHVVVPLNDDAYRVYTRTDSTAGDSRELGDRTRDSGIY